MRRHIKRRDTQSVFANFHPDFTGAIYSLERGLRNLMSCRSEAHKLLEQHGVTFENIKYNDLTISRLCAVEGAAIVECLIPCRG